MSQFRAIIQEMHKHSRNARHKEYRRLAKVKKEKLKQKQLEELEREFQTEHKIRLRDNGPDDEHLINAVTTGSYIEIENVLKERDEYSQEALDKSLIIAANNGQKLILVLLLKYGANTNWTDENGNTSLMICAEKGYLDMAKLLIANKADVNMLNTSGNTALILSVKASGAADMTRLLVSSSSVDVKNHDGQTALTKSVEVGDLDTIHILITNGANLDEVTNGETVLDIANKKGILQYIKVFSDFKPPIAAALTYRDLLLVETILTYEPNSINQRASDGSTALDTFFDLILTEKKGLSSVDKSIIKLLITRGVSVNKKDSTKSIVIRQDSKNDTPLTKAVQIGDLDIVKWLCIKGSQVNESVGNYQFTPLMMASKCGFPEITMFLLSKGADIEVKKKEGTAMDIAVKYGHLDCAKILLEEKANKGLLEAYKIAIEHKQLCLLEHLDEKFTLDTKETSLIKWAIHSDSKDIFQYLINKGMDVNESINQENYYTNDGPTYASPLHAAVINEKPEFIEVLLQHKANINMKDSDGYTVLFCACAQKNTEIVTLLLNSGSDVNVTNNFGRTPLFTASERKDIKTVTLLLKSGASVNVFDNEAETPMLKAIRSQSLELVSLLIDWKADTSTITKNGGTYVTEVISVYNVFESEEDLQILKLLLQEKIDINKQDCKGNTALIKACKHSMTEAVELILKHGADVNLANSKNHTALSYSLNVKDFRIVKMLLQKEAKFHPLINCQQGLHLIISKNERELIPLALGQGVYPFAVNKSGRFYSRIFSSFIHDDISPLSLALHERRLELAKYLIQVRFLTKYDVSGLLKKDIFQRTIMSTEQDTIFNNMLSLYTLSFVQISDMLGATLDREEKVNKLPLPVKMKKQLLFRSLNVPLVVSEKKVIVF